MNSLRSLNPYLLKHKKGLIWGAIFIIISDLLAIVPVKVIGKSINIIVEKITKVESFSNDKDFLKTIFIYGIIIILSPVVYGVFRFFMRQQIIVVSRKIEYELKNLIYEQYQKLSYVTLMNSKVGDLLNRLSEDIVNVRMYLGPGVMYTLNLIILSIIVFISMIFSDYVLTLCVIVPIPILVFLVYKISNIINIKTKITQAQQSNLSSFVQDSFSGIRIIKSFSTEDFFQDRYEKESEDYRKKYLSLVKTEAFFYPLIIIVLGLCNLFILYIGGLRYIEGKVDVGTITDFFLYLNILIIPFISFGWVTSIVRRAQASMGRITQFLEEEKEVENVNLDIYPIRGKIEFRNVSYTYFNTDIKALDKVSFVINPGEKVAIMGRTGSGKSTIALLLTRLIEPDEGDILIDDMILAKHNLNLIRKKIGYVPQESFLFSDTVANNIGYGLDFYDLNSIIKYAKLAEVHQNIMELENKYETQVGERGVSLSGGQKQRISIARTFIKKPDIYIFDDCLSAVDAKKESKILENIDKESKDKTTIIITHRKTISLMVDRVLGLENGKII